MPPHDHTESYYVATAKGMTAHARLAGEVNCDVCVVGGGFTGLSAALHLAEAGYAVVLLDANRIAWGASGRNGGQVNSGLRLAPTDLVARFGREEARRLWALAEEAKETVRERIRRHAIPCDFKPGVLLTAVKASHLGPMAKDVECLKGVFGYERVRLVSSEETAAMVDGGPYHGAVLDEGAGHLHPLNYALGLAQAAEAAGARLFEDSAVTAIERPVAGGAATVRTAGGSVRARFVVVGCNAYLGRLESRLAAKILPIGSYVLATAPLGAERARRLIRDDVAVCDTRFVVNYYRLSADHRLLFGGGETYTGREPRDLKAFVRAHMLRVFPQLADVGIDYAWGGRVAITLNRLPHFGRLAPNVYFAHGYSGQGVALATLAGKLIAEAIAGTAERFDVFARLRHRDFPGGARLRRPIAAIGMLYYSLRDRL